jgi:hypothetical protein
VERKPTGDYHVRAYRPAIGEARKMFRRTRDFFEVRRQALKLKYWPRSGPAASRGQLLDLDWSWIEGIATRDVGELRIHDVIANHDNLRIIFFVGADPVNTRLPTIWILKVLQKKSDEFTINDIRTFTERRRQILHRFGGKR